jgi:predicted acylesterase/phospholipase RssA
MSALVVSGGGLKGLCSLGCLHYLYTKGKLKDVKVFAGSSIGSVICGLLACGVAPSVIFSRVYISEIINVSNVIENIPRFLEKFGFIDISEILNIVRKILNEFCIDGENTTFKNVYDQYNHELLITSVNITKQTNTIFSKDNTPDMPIIRAMELSCNIPFVFTRQVYEGDEYVDGSISNHIPINIIDRSLKTICVLTRFAMPTGSPSEISIADYILKIILIPVRLNIASSINEIKKCDNIDLYDIKVDDAIQIVGNISASQKLELFKSGYEWAEFLSNPN